MIAFRRCLMFIKRNTHQIRQRFRSEFNNVCFILPAIFIPSKQPLVRMQRCGELKPGSSLYTCAQDIRRARPLKRHGRR